MTLCPSVAVTDVTFAFEIDVIAPALTKSVKLLCNITRFQIIGYIGAVS